MSGNSFCGGVTLGGDYQEVRAIVQRMARSTTNASAQIHFEEGAGVALCSGNSKAAIQFAQEGSCTIVFAGTLFNAPALCSNLSIDKQEDICDAAVALRCFLTHGPSCFADFEGPFALAVYNAAEGRVTLSRDQFGQKPLYYFQNDRFFLFASSIGHLINSGVMRKEIDAAALTQYLQLTYVPAPLSIFKGILKMMPGTWMSVTAGGGVYTETYWALDYKAGALIEDYEECKWALRKEVFAAVERRLPTHGIGGCLLSGGIDSSIITAVASQLSQQRLHTFTVGHDDRKFDERDHARLVADRYGTEHHVLMLDSKHALQGVERIVDTMEEPYADSSVIAAHAILDFAADFVPFVLTGDAGDELFAGYSKYLVDYYATIYNKVPGFIQKSVIEPVFRAMPRDWALVRKAGKVIRNAGHDIFLQRRNMMCLGFDVLDINAILSNGVDVESALDFLRPIYDRFVGSADEITRAQYLDLNVVLEGDMFPKAHLAAMSTGLSSHPPFIANSVVSLAYRIPSNYKIHGRYLKRVLKDSFSDLIPKELLSAPKRGFSVPMETWLRSLLRKELQALTEANWLEQQGIFQPLALRQVVEEHLTGSRNRFSELWAVFVLQKWYRRWMQ